jgi:hypothetical protein
VKSTRSLQPSTRQKQRFIELRLGLRTTTETGGVLGSTRLLLESDHLAPFYVDEAPLRPVDDAPVRAVAQGPAACTRDNLAALTCV